jgi:polysaccharide export outer membrane protein
MNLTFNCIILSATNKFTGFLVGVLLLSSCVSQRKIEYLQQKNKGVTEYLNNSYREYKLRPYDELFIQINSLDDEQSNIIPAAPTGSSIAPNTQKVDKDGYLELPVIGKIQVKDKSVEEVTSLLKESFKNVLNMPMISVRLASCYVTILGEVRAPGHFMYVEDKFNIFNALSMAGDISEFGNRKKVIILRHVDGKTKQAQIDLTKASVVASELYYIQPYDVIYVKPLPKILGFREIPLSEVVSLASLGILIYTVIQQQ